MLALPFGNAANREFISLQFRPNDRDQHTVFVSPCSTNGTMSTHVSAAIVQIRSEADLGTWLRYAVSGTALVLHLSGTERIGFARRMAWFAETCRRYDVDLAIAADGVTRNALELLQVLGAETVRFDERMIASLPNDRRRRLLVNQIKSLAGALALDLQNVA